MFTGGHHSFQSAQEPPALRRAVRCRFPRRVFADGAPYLTAFIGRNEIDGGVEGHARAKTGGGSGPRNLLTRPNTNYRRQNWARSRNGVSPSDGDASVFSRNQARPVDTYSSRRAVIRHRDGLSALNRKDADPRRIGHEFLYSQSATALGRRVKPLPQGSKFCAPSLLQQAARDFSVVADAVIEASNRNRPGLTHTQTTKLLEVLKEME